MVSVGSRIRSDRRLKHSYVLHMASPPERGNCTANPSRGVVLQDQFTISCSGFNDPGTPLTYFFYFDPGMYPVNENGDYVANLPSIATPARL